MRRKTVCIFLIVVLILSISANAASPKYVQANPQIYFRGTYADCSATILSEHPNDTIHVTMQLTQNGSFVARWRSDGTGRVSMSETADVEIGKTYTLTVMYSINGVRQPDVSVTRTNNG